MLIDTCRRVGPDTIERRLAYHIDALEGAPTVLTASGKCPLCGHEGPHPHTPLEQTIYRNGIKAGRSAVETKAEPDIALDKDGPYCDEHLTDVRAWCVECMTCTAERKENAVEPRETSARIGPADPDNDMVICPTCTSQFRAIPVNVQTKLTDAETFKRSIRISLEMWPEESPDEPRETTGPQPIGDYVLLSDMGETNVQGYGNCLFATHDAVKSPTHQETVLVDRTALLGLVGVLQDRVHQDLGRVRAGRSVKVHKENCQKRLTDELNFKKLSVCDCGAEKASGEQS